MAASDDVRVPVHELRERHQRRSPWRWVAFGATALVWAPVSGLVWVMVEIALVGFSTDNAVSGGLLDGSSDLIGVVVLALGLEVIGGGVLVALARWAWGRKDQATALGVVATIWLQALAAVGFVT
jgi:hypothetical protein